jgi:hypothetical protein
LNNVTNSADRGRRRQRHGADNNNNNRKRPPATVTTIKWEKKDWQLVEPARCSLEETMENVRTKVGIDQAIAAATAIAEDEGNDEHKTKLLQLQPLLDKSCQIAYDARTGKTARARQLPRIFCVCVCVCFLFPSHFSVVAS